MTLEIVDFFTQILAGEKQRLGRTLAEDGRRIEAFFDDLKDAVANAKSIDEIKDLLDIPCVLFMKAQAGAKGIRLDPSTWDILKEFRSFAKTTAETLKFNRYLDELKN